MYPSPDSELCVGGTLLQKIRQFVQTKTINLSSSELAFAFDRGTASVSSQILGTRPAFGCCSNLRRHKRSASLHRLLNECPHIPQVLLSRENISQSDSHD